MASHIQSMNVKSVCKASLIQGRAVYGGLHVQGLGRLGVKGFYLSPFTPSKKFSVKRFIETKFQHEMD